MKLLDAPKNIPIRLVGYMGGKGVETKLRHLGLTPGREIKVLKLAPIGGPIMVDVEGRSVALGRGIAAKIQVEEI
jgi:ferrous iron transport protein A